MTAITHPTNVALHTITDAAMSLVAISYDRPYLPTIHVTIDKYGVTVYTTRAGVTAWAEHFASSTHTTTGSTGTATGTEGRTSSGVLVRVSSWEPAS